MDFSWVDTIVGAMVTWSAYRVGKRHTRKQPLDTGDPKPICRGCRHGRSYHEKGTGRCRYTGFDHCKCQGYDGPEPLPEFYV